MESEKKNKIQCFLLLRMPQKTVKRTTGRGPPLTTVRVRKKAGHGPQLTTGKKENRPWVPLTKIFFPQP